MVRESEIFSDTLFFCLIRIRKTEKINFLQIFIEGQKQPILDHIKKIQHGARSVRHVRADQ